MKKALLLQGVLLLSLVSGLAGCSSTNNSAAIEESSAPTGNDRTLSSWSSLTSEEKSQAVTDEFTRLGYVGSVTPDDVVGDIDRGKGGPFPNILTFQNEIDTQLSGEISFAENIKLDGMSDKQKLDELNKFINGAEFKVLEDVSPDVFASDFTKQLNDLKSKQSTQKKNTQTCPLKIIKAYVSPDSIGTPEAYVIVNNKSGKTVDAYKVSIFCYNSFGDPVNDPGTGSNEFSGIAQNQHISPGETFGSDYSWMLALQDTTTKISATITEIHFTDGTTWSPDGQ